MTNNLARFFGIQSSQGRYRHALQSIQEKLQPSHCFIGKFVDNNKVRTVLHLADGEEAKNFVYDLTGTPCAEAKKSLETCNYPCSVQDTFPHDDALKQWQIESYMAVTIRSFNDKPVGILVCLFDHATDILPSDCAWFREVSYLVGAEFKYELNSVANEQLISNMSLGESLAKLCTIEWHVNSDTVFASAYAYQLFGLSVNEPLTRQQFSALVVPKDQARVIEQLIAIKQGDEKSFEIDFGITTPAGNAKHIKVLGETKVDSLTGELIVQLSIQDITEQQLLIKQLALADTVLENSSEAVMISDRHNKIIWVNKALENLTGYDKTELIGQDPAVFSSGKQGDEFYQSMWKSLAETGVWRGEIYNQRKNGEVFPEELLLNAVKDEHGEICNYVAIFSDISEWKETERRLRFYADKEPLTGLANRRAFIESVAHHVQQSKTSHQPFVVMYLDINRFKEINDIYGHVTGDFLLVAVGKRLQEAYQNTQLICRYSGDEFTLLFPNSDLEQAMLKAKEIQQLLLKPFEFEELALSIQVCIGLAEFSQGLCCENNATATELLKNASQAMQRSKATVSHDGSNDYTIGVHDQQLQKQYMRRLALRDKLKLALAGHALTVHYQPIVCAKNHQIEKFEALVRWYDDHFGAVSPAEFIPIAEEFGLISKLGQFVLERACEDLALLHQQGYEKISFNINRSINEFRTDNDQVALVKQAIAKHDLAPNKIVIEITESVAMSSNRYVNDALAKLKEYGVKIALDDFCTGYSSISNLIEYPVDILKIDKSFVDNILIERNQSLLTQTLIDLAGKLDMQVVAEGVETIEQLDCLRDYGCDLIQGYYFSPALPIDECIAMLAKERD